MYSRDIIGERGESIFRILLTRKHPTRDYLFEHPNFLGEKKRTIDFLVELIHNESLIPFFFVQVKATTEGYTQTEQRLKVKVASKDMKRLAAYPAPTYLVGIDEPNEQGYIVSANGECTTGLSSLCTNYPLEPNILALLWEEVKTYWASPNLQGLRSSHFLDPKWSES